MAAKGFELFIVRKYDEWGVGRTWIPVGKAIGLGQHHDRVQSKETDCAVISRARRNTIYEEFLRRELRSPIGGAGEDGWKMGLV